MNYCVEIIRDDQLNISDLRILLASEDLFALVRGKECVMVQGPSTDDLSIKKPILNEDGSITIGHDPVGLANKARAAANQTQQRINEEARAYLQSTDWYVFRKTETGEEIPEEILAARASARASIVKI